MTAHPVRPGQRARRQHEAKRRRALAADAVLEPRAVQAALAGRRHRRLGLPVVGGDPGQNALEITTRREDRGALDDLAPGGMRS